MIKQSKGVTLVVLVVTIIILLILAGISLAEFTGHGLFAQAQKAKLETKRSTITEWLDIKLIEEQTNNSSGTAEEIIEATRENVILHQEELLEIGKEVEIEEIKDEEDGKKTEVYFYVIVDEDVYKVELEGVKFIGRKGEFPPIIRITGVTNTTNTITVTVETQRNEEGKIEYWIKAEDEEEYRKIGETEGEEKSYIYEELIQNKKYNIKVIAIAKNKKTAEATAEETTGTVTSGTTIGAITFSIPTWSNGKASTTISTNTSYTIQYQVNSTTETWTTGSSVTGMSHGDKVYARLWDGTNSGDYATVTIVDAVTPTTATINAGTVSSAKSVVLTASGTDNESGIKEYAIYVNESKVSSRNTYTITNMPFNTSYSCYVIVTDAAGNTKQSSTITAINQSYVSDATDLKNLAKAVNSGTTFSGKTITQTANINLGGSSSNQWTTIGNNSNAFAGTYNGNYKNISNIYINNTSNYQGLFGYSTGSISNLTISSGTISGNRYIGGIVGYIKGTIENCHNYSSVSGQYFVGGIVGTSEGVITKCSNYGELISRHIQTDLTSGALGGIAGAEYSTSGTISYCFNKGNITLNSSITGIYVGCAGGIVGLMYGNTQCCYNTGNIYARDFYASGIVGACRKEGWINYCYNIGSIQGNGDKNGIIGWNDHVDITSDMIYKIYYLNTCGGNGSGESINSVTMKTKYGTSVLRGFKKDTNNINGGYPILEWQ